MGDTVDVGDIGLDEHLGIRGGGGKGVDIDVEGEYLPSH
jgi:hypothetical protein